MDAVSEMQIVGTALPASVSHILDIDAKHFGGAHLRQEERSVAQSTAHIQSALAGDVERREPCKEAARRGVRLVVDLLPKIRRPRFLTIRDQPKERLLPTMSSVLRGHVLSDT